MERLRAYAGPPALSSLFLLLSLLAASRGLKTQPLEVGALFGVSAYNGDLSPVDNLDYLKMLRPAGGVFLRYGPTEWLGFRLGLTVTRLHGDARFNTTTVYKQQPVLLRTPLQDLALTAEVSPFQVRIFGFNIRPYLYGGVAVYRFDPQLRINGEWIRMQPLGTEGQGLAGQPERYRTTRFAVPAGGGIRVAVSERIVLGAEAGGRLAYTDYLDDISGRTLNYPFLLEELGLEVASLSNPLATDTTRDFRRGNGAGDFYYFGAVSLHYRFGGEIRAREVKCYRF